jgi:geranylgeranyl pyrophosphate synthase
MEHASTAQRTSLLKLFASIPDNPAVKIKEVKGIFDALEVRGITNKTIDSYFDLAISHLKAIGLPEKDTDVLRNYAASLMQRQV